MACTRDSISKQVFDNQGRQLDTPKASHTARWTQWTHASHVGPVVQPVGYLSSGKYLSTCPALHSLDIDDAAASSA